MKYLLKVTALFLFVALIFTGCKENVSAPDDETITDKEAMLKLIDDDETLSSFEANFDEGQAMDIVFGKTAAQIYPVRIGQKMILTDRELEVVFEGDTAYGTLTCSFEGILFIAASVDSIDWTNPLDIVDTLIEKPFNTTVKRNLVFAKRGNAVNDDTTKYRRNWRIIAFSLAEGGTFEQSSEIIKMTFTTSDGQEYVVEEPLETYFSQGVQWRRRLCSLGLHREVHLKVEISSMSAEDEYVSITYGATKNGMQWRAKRFLTLTSVNNDGKQSIKTYEGTIVAGNVLGHKHAVVNVVPYNVIHDDSYPVQVDSWGFPYLVK